MRFPLLLALPLLAAAPPLAPPVVSVTLANYGFMPSDVMLVHGRPIILRLTNNSYHGHNFVAPEFFAAAQIDPASRALVERGGVEVGRYATLEVRLIAPPPGRYPLRCSHFTHALRGMTGTIVVS